MGTNRSVRYIRAIILAVILTFIKLICIIGILVLFDQIEFVYRSDKEVFGKIIVYGIPISIIVSLSVTLNRSYGFIRNLGIITSTICISVAIFIILCMLLFSYGMCEKFNERIVYKSLKNNQTQIIECTIGCGATDSSPSSKIFIKSKSYLNFICIIERIDSNEINKKEWIYVNEPWIDQ